MTDLRALLQNEYKDISFNTEAAQIISMYNKQRRRKLGTFLGTAMCLIMIMTVFVQMNPEAIESFRISTGKFLSSLFAVQNSVTVKDPTEATTVPVVVTVEPTTAATSSEPKATETTQSHVQGNTEPTQPSVGGNVTDEIPQATEEETKATEQRDETAETEETKPRNKSGVESKTLETARIKYIKISSKTIRITKCVPLKNRMVIPDEIDGYTVTEIGEGILKGYNSVYEVVLPDTVTRIGDNAFKGLDSLESVNIPKSIRKIGASAFEGCSSVESVDLRKVESIGDRAFFDCDSLTAITIPETAKLVGINAFYDCDELESAVIGSNCDVGSDRNNGYTFAECSSLRSVTFLDGVTKTSSYQFYHCTALESVTLPTTLKTIGQSSFSCCTSVDNLELPEGLETIGQTAFYKCRALSTLNLPDSLRYIYKKAFYGCNGLISVTVPTKVAALSEKCLGYYDKTVKKVTVDAKINGFTIRGYSGTLAQTYAKDNKFVFESIGQTATPTNIVLDSYIETLKVGETYRIKPYIEHPSGDTAFTSSDKSVAEVDADGTVTALKSGKATIEVSNNGATRQFIVIVK